MELVLIHTERKVAFASVPHKSSPLKANLIIPSRGYCHALGHLVVNPSSAAALMCTKKTQIRDAKFLKSPRSWVNRFRKGAEGGRGDDKAAVSSWAHVHGSMISCFGCFLSSTLNISYFKLCESRWESLSFQEEQVMRVLRLGRGVPGEEGFPIQHPIWAGVSWK